MAAIALTVPLALSSTPQVALATTTAVDQEQLLVEEMYCIKASPIIGCADGRSQMVQVGVTGALVAVDLYMGRQSIMTEDVVIEIRDGYLDGQILSTSEPVSSADLPVLPDADWVRFTFDQPAFLTVRDVYSIVVPIVSQDGDADWKWGGTVSTPSDDVYPEGEGWSCNEYATCVLNGHDHAFVTWMEDVPIPQTTAPTTAPLPASTVAPTAAPTLAPIATASPRPTPTARPTPTSSPRPTPTATDSPTPSPSELAAELASAEADQGSSGPWLGLLAATAALVAVASFGGRAWLLRRSRLELQRQRSPRE